MITIPRVVVKGCQTLYLLAWFILKDLCRLGWQASDLHVYPFQIDDNYPTSYCKRFPTIIFSCMVYLERFVSFWMASTRFACLFNCGITEYNFFGHITREAGAQNDWFKIRMNDGSSIPIISQQPLRFFKHLLGFTSLSAWQIAKAPLSVTWCAHVLVFHVGLWRKFQRWWYV